MIPKYAGKDFLVSILCSIGIASTNALLAKAIQYLCSYEYFTSNTQYQAACSWKIGIGQAMNSTIAILLANIVLHNPTFLGVHHDDTGAYLKHEMWNSDGLGQDILLINITNMAVHSLSYIFAPAEI